MCGWLKPHLFMQTKQLTVTDPAMQNAVDMDVVGLQGNTISIKSICDGMFKNVVQTIYCIAEGIRE